MLLGYPPSVLTDSGGLKWGIEVTESYNEALLYKEVFHTVIIVV